jgi:hypothetical protein
MKNTQVNKSAMTLLMIGLLVMTFFIPFLSTSKNFTNIKYAYTVIVKATDNSTNNQTQNQTSVNLIEEEEEYTTEVARKFEIQLPILITISFSLPNLFFKDFYGEVSGPPPWL